MTLDKSLGLELPVGYCTNFSPVGGGRYSYAPMSQAPLEGLGLPPISESSAVMPRLVKLAPTPLAGEPD